MSDLPKRMRDLLSMFEGITDQEERMSVLLGYADKFKAVPPEIAQRPYSDSNKVPFCESEAYIWVLPERGGTVNLHFAVENPSGVSAKALAAILERTLSGAVAEQVASVSTDIVEKIFRQNISMGKGMGLMGMVAMVKVKAMALAKQA